VIGRKLSKAIRGVHGPRDSKEEIKLATLVYIVRQKERLFEAEQAIYRTKQAIATEKHLEGMVSMSTLKCMMAARGFKAKRDKALHTIASLEKLLKEIDESNEETEEFEEEDEEEVDYDYDAKLRDIIPECIS
jgi:hypothetical protein